MLSSGFRLTCITDCTTYFLPLNFMHLRRFEWHVVYCGSRSFSLATQCTEVKRGVRWAFNGHEDWDHQLYHHLRQYHQCLTSLPLVVYSWFQASTTTRASLSNSFSLWCFCEKLIMSTHKYSKHSIAAVIHQSEDSERLLHSMNPLYKSLFSTVHEEVKQGMPGAARTWEQFLNAGEGDAKDFDTLKVEMKRKVQSTQESRQMAVYRKHPVRR